MGCASRDLRLFVFRGMRGRTVCCKSLWCQLSFEAALTVNPHTLPGVKDCLMTAGFEATKPAY